MSALRYGSVCSGVEAATVAWHPLGWESQWFSEIEKFPSAVLAHHYPNTPNLGDMTAFKEWPNDPVDVLVGGTPCQSFSVAGLRKGLSDPRGNLMLTYLAIAAQYQPKWLVWENVPGVLSSNRGRDFGTFLGALGELGYGFAYRVLDAQYFGVAQRRKRVFVVGYAGDWKRAAAVLFERESLSGHPAPSREAREKVAPTVTQGAPFSRTGNDRVEADALVAKWPSDVASTLNAAFGSKQGLEDQHINGGAPLFVPVAFGEQNSANQGDSVSTEVTPTLDKSKTPAVAFQPVSDCLTSAYSTKWNGNASATNGSLFAQQASQVRRLTPRECERLQGFPDDYTQIPYRNKPAESCPDGPRYKAMGNSMAVPVMRWIGERINMVNSIGENI
jgi:DNA (cytosine-5)-methyltransferase 1